MEFKQLDQTWQDRIVASFIREDDDERSRTYRCAICSKLYRRPAAAAKHVLTHTDESVFETRMEELLIADAKASIEVSFARFQTALDELASSETDLNKAKTDFVETFEVNPTRAIAWHAKRVIKLQTQTECTRNILAAREEAGSDLNLIERFERFEEIVERFKNALVDMPPEHNSSCPFSNVIAQIQFAAKCEMLRAWTNYFSTAAWQAKEYKKARKRLVDLENELYGF
jgi:hypothetical protein